MTPRRTPSQTVGPFFAVMRPLASPAPPDAVRVFGVVLDGAGAPVNDALVETWAPVPGHVGRCATDGDGAWAIETPKPAALDDHAPHLAVAIFARGLLQRAATRLYFGDEVEANERDPLLASLPPDLRERLVAQPADGGYRFDVVLQGTRESVFLAL